jgi:type IV pilus assembly protein PilW
MSTPMTALRVRTPSPAAWRVSGFTLIELMIGLVVSLIGTFAMLSAFALFEGQKRTTTSGNDAQQNGSFALYELERQLRSAGSGLIQGKKYSLPGCLITAYVGGSRRIPGSFPSPFSAFTYPVQANPVLVASGGTSAGVVAPDTIQVIAGNPAARVFEAGVTNTLAGGNAIVVNNSVGIYGSEYLLATNVGSGCALGVVASFTEPNVFNLDPTTLPAGGMAGASYVFDLGLEPALSLYGVDTKTTPNSLDRYDMLAASLTPIADGIVQLKALYGVDDGANGGVAGDDVIDEWVAPTIGTEWGIDKLTSGTPAAILNISQIKAIRVAVVAQSELPERANTYTGPTSLTLFGDLETTCPTCVFTVSIGSQFRYKAYETTIPIRNALVTHFF